MTRTMTSDERQTLRDAADRVQALERTLETIAEHAEATGHPLVDEALGELIDAIADVRASWECDHGIARGRD